jgi:predicted DNA-binding ribbon-helix-helix protein
VTRPLKRSFTIKGHRTSITIEREFWDALRQAAASEQTTLAALVAAIDRERGAAGLSSAVRVWLLDYFRGRPGKEIARVPALRSPRNGR